jgi:ABC-2 type transport system permease protein
MLANVFTKTTQDRWKAMAIGALTLGLFLVFGMAVYRDIDLSVYTDLPEAMRALMNMPADADVGALAYGAIYGSYGALTMAGLAVSMGSATIAGEERLGTIGLLLGNPRSRTQVLVAKAGSLLLVTGLGIGILWLIGIATPAVLDVNVGGMHIEALMVHMLVNALFYGFLAMAIGAFTGSVSVASGVTAGAMVVAFFAAGLLPLVDGLEDWARLSPWHYFDGNQPVNNGVAWGDVALLAGGSAAFAAAAFVGVNRRDLKEKAVRATLADRLRSNPLTQQVVNRLAGSARVSRMWIKTASEHQGLAMISAAVMFLFMVMLGPMYNFIDDALQRLTESLPETMLALFGGGDMSTPEGWYQVEMFSLMAPLAVMIVTVVVGSRALAGEEANNTMGLLLANPITRSSIVWEKCVAMVVLAFLVGAGIFAGAALGSIAGGLGMNLANLGAASLLVTLLGLVIGALALLLGAMTGRVRTAVYGSVGLALTFYIANAFLPLDDSVAGLARWTPNYYYLTSDPLVNGLDWGHGAVLATLTVVLMAAAAVLFQRRDLRQSG